ncbi:GntR family transcriptional regulator [Aquibium sp. LZ166]|uniref:GntR family transcriptional regulator n=1 Tax=Aquibium pacificus TaxID=3153579 RepID=A0ABV3SMQ0_9HYPH
MNKAEQFETQGRGEAGGQSRATVALLAMRGMILNGSLGPGERVSELAIVEQTGISRTPVRAALQRLEEEGFVEAIPSGGFAVKSFSETDVFDAIEIRGTLEGLAARLAAERGSSTVRLSALHECVAELDRLVPASLDSEDGFMRYMSANARLHALIVELAESPSLKRQIERAVSLPFASPNAFIKAQTLMPESRGVLIVAQDQHRCVAEAIADRQGARAQAIMQEHARLAGRHLRLALRDDKVLEQVPGGSLIRTGR